MQFTKDCIIHKRKNLKFEDVKIILDTFGKIDACGNMSDPIYWPHFEQMLEHTLKLNWQELHIHTNGSGKKLLINLKIKLGFPPHSS